MSNPDLEEAVALMLAEPTLLSRRPPRPASDALIAAAQQRLGVRFPDSYSDSQRRFGAVSFGSAEFLGLIDENFDTNSDPCAISSTLHHRKVGHLPVHLVNVHNVGEGTHYVLNTAALDRGECPVLAWRHGDETEPAYSTYGELVLELVQAQIERQKRRAQRPPRG